ncbi:hypothetical protein EYC84_008577 [Monilinia fructicola]|uniref:J domain-containing protein n=1 Tax=Monilinia fructicola TaxID=38448 RepID=A0A5M9JMB1_MONFR|nr:hypothetical protein EYC84_008577 [Monilinia fructicola]
MPSDDLTKWITSEVDFYTLLGITPESFTAEELRRAYRKTALRYHPDKLGDAFDPDKYEQFQAANDVLADPELKQKYDNYRNARVQKERAAALFEGKRRAMKEDLEARKEEEVWGREVERMKRWMLRLEGWQKRVGRGGRKGRAHLRPQSSTSNPPPSTQTQAKEQEEAQEDEEIGIYNPPESPAPTAPSNFTSTTKENKEGIETPIKRPDIFNGLKADSKSASTSTSSPKFSFSPNAGKKVGGVSDFAATMERLKEAERKRLEGEIREREAREV